MNVENLVFSVDAREFHQVENSSACILGIIALFDLLSGPEDRSLSRSAESLRVIDRSIIVIANHANIHLHDKVQALSGIWTIANDVTQTEDSLNILSLDVLEHRFECFEVTVNVANNRSSQDTLF
jgi:hypothetical protein